MADKLKTGYIYRIKYSNYKNDPEPFILCLYSGSKTKNVHAININYLTPRLTSDLIEMVARISTKKLKYDNAYDLYHSHIKKSLPKIVQRSYRTYNRKHINSVRTVSKGYFNIKHFLQWIQHNFTPRDVSLVRKKLRQSYLLGKNEKYLRMKAKVFSLFKKNEEITYEELKKRTEKYISEINRIRSLNPKNENKKDLKKFTYFK